MSRDLATTLRTALTPAVWGTTYLVATELLPDGRPLLAATVRALPVGLAFVAVTRHLPSGAWWFRAGLLGLLNIGAFFALLFVAAFRLPGGVAATAGAVQPLVAAGLAAILLGERFTSRTALAGLTGMAGVGLLVLGPEAALDPIGIAAAVLGTISMATGVVLTKHWGRPVDLLTFTGWQLAAGGLALLPAALAVEGVPGTITGPNVAGFLWLAVVGTGAAYANWFRGIEELPVAVVSFLALLSPLVATVAGWSLLGQGLSAAQLLGAALVFAAVVASHRSGQSTDPGDPAIEDGSEGDPIGTLATRGAAGIGPPNPSPVPGGAVSHRRPLEPAASCSRTGSRPPVASGSPPPPR